MSTTFTPVRPSALGIMLHTSGVLIGRVCRFSLDLVREAARSKGAHAQKKGCSQQRPAPVPKPEKVFTLEEIRNIPTVLRRAGVDQEEWYRTHVLDSDDEYFKALREKYSDSTTLRRAGIDNSFF